MKYLAMKFMFIICLISGCAAPAIVNQSVPEIDSKYTPAKEFTVVGSSGWQSSGITLKKGQNGHYKVRWALE